MHGVPRIVVADSSSELARIVRGALALLRRPAILVEVPTSDDVVQEVAATEVDLVVTACRVPGQLNGLELAHSIVHESLRTPVIVLAEEDDPLPDAAALAAAPFQVYARPAAEAFLRGLRAALDGEAVGPVEEPPGQDESDLGPVPPLNAEATRGILSSLLRDVGAMGVFVADRTGRVIIDQGATGYVDREGLAALLSPTIARGAPVGALLGGRAWSLHYYDGERLDIFALTLGLHYFMVLLFDPAHRGAFGAVRMFGRRAADRMIEMMGEAAYRTRRGVPYASPPPLPTSSGPLPAADSTAPVALDFDALFSQEVDESQADRLFDADALTDLANSLPADSERRVNYDEAVDLGILDEPRRPPSSSPSE